MPSVYDSIACRALSAERPDGTGHYVGSPLRGAFDHDA